MNLDVLAGPAEVAHAAADMLAREAAARPQLVLALPTGRTPIAFYDELTARHSRGEIDLAAARGFNLDELVLPPEDPRSFRSFMQSRVWGRTGLQRERCDIPAGAATDLEEECLRYDAAIEAAGGLDVAILGLGADGHVGYNLPGPVSLATHVVRLPDTLAASLGLPPHVWPLRAITMGLGAIRGARTLLVIATGPSKAGAVRALIEGPEDSEWPCSLLRTHPDLHLFLDGLAAAGSTSLG